jgi:RNA polymerase sigma-70 factor, ECF subfamily
VDITASSVPDGFFVELVASFDAFYVHEYPATVRLLTALTGRRDVAEELAQDVFVTAHARWHAVHHFERPDAWVRRVAVNRGTSWVRRRTVETRLLTRLSARPTPLVQLSESADETWRAVRHLPARQAQVIALVYLEDRTVADVAEILDCSPDTIRTHLRRARSTLAARLQVSDDTSDTSRQPDGAEP